MPWWVASRSHLPQGQMMIDHDDTPMSEAEIEAWRQDELVFGVLDRAAAFEPEVLKFWPDIVRGRAHHQRQHAASAVAAVQRKIRAAENALRIREAAQAYRKRNPGHTMTAMAMYLARTRPADLHPAGRGRRVRVHRSHPL